MILITGGLGYLGSHIALNMLAKGHEVVLVDNLSHASVDRLEQLEFLTKMYIPFVRLDVRNTPVLQKVFEQYAIDYVIHTAGFKSLSESRQKPLEYYNNNIGCMMSILRAMQRTGVRRLVNLSSIAVYGESGNDWREDDALNLYVTNPYVRAQQLNEQMLRDIYAVDQYWQILNIRLANVIGAYPDGLMGEWISLIPKAVLPNLLQVAAGHKDHLELQHGFNTADGSVERDFIHVKDAVDAIYKLMVWSNTQQNFLQDFNVASGQCISIKTLMQHVESVTEQTISPAISLNSNPELGDFAQLSADIHKLKATIEWQPQYTVDDAIAHQWAYYQRSLQHKA